jgi:hypothetical protein
VGSVIKYLQETAFFMPEITRLLLIDFIKTFIVKVKQKGPYFEQSLPPIDIFGKSE